MLEETAGYIMRISNDDWVTQVFELKRYYSGIIRKWRIGTPILFAKKNRSRGQLSRIRDNRQSSDAGGNDARGGKVLRIKRVEMLHNIQPFEKTQKTTLRERNLPCK